MKAELFQDLTTVLKTLVKVGTVTWDKGTPRSCTPANVLANVLVDHGTPAEVKKLMKQFPALPWDTAETTTEKSVKKAPSKPVKAAVAAKVPVPIVDSPNRVTVILGPYGTEVQARAEAEQFKHPQVFLYRSAIFPMPQNFRVKTRVLESQVVRTTGNDILYPYGVQLKIQVDGDPEKVRSWIEAFKTRARPVQMG